MKRILILMMIGTISMVLATPAMAIPMGDFFAWGGGVSDATVTRNDDGYSPQINLSTPFTYFGQLKNSLHVNTNGNITFDGPMSTYTPFSFPGGRQIVAPYFADVDTRNLGSGLVHYGERSTPSLLNPISDAVNTAFGGSFAGTYGFVATWDHVGYYGNHADLLNTFQMALVTDGVDSFAIFNYLDDGMTWETGDASGGSGGFGGTQAVAGFDAGDSTNFFMISGSRAAGIAEILEDGSNIGVPGQWVFQINEGQIIDPNNPIPEPASMFLLGSGLLGLLGYRKRKIA